MVALDEKGDRDFALYRANCADASYAPEEVDADVIRASRLLHVGSLSLATPVSTAAQRHAVQVAREAGLLVSADPNLRPAVWADKTAMIAAGREAVDSADIVKLSGEELAMLSGADDAAEGVRRLWHPRLKVMAVTDGERGAVIHTRGLVRRSRWLCGRGRGYRRLRRRFHGVAARRPAVDRPCRYRPRRDDRGSAAALRPPAR